VTNPQRNGSVVPEVEIAENEPAEEMATASVAQQDLTSLESAAPAHLAAFWDEIDAELAATPANPEETEVPLYSTEFSTTYSVKLTSIGPYRISAFVSVPHGDGPFPALMLAPGYASVVTPPPYEDRKRYVVMSLRYRGTRGSDWPYAAKFPGMLTDGIDDPHSWIMRGVIADTLRGFEYLASRPEVDPARIAIMGGDSGLFVTARRSGIAAQAVNAAFWYRLREAHTATEAYPLEEINDYVRTWPDKADAVRTTLAYFDPVYLADQITAKVLIASDNPDWYAPLRDALGGETEDYATTHEGQTDRDAIDAWIAGELGVNPIPRIWKAEDIGPWSS
jgi:cephalosporin-C deacetylase